LQIESTALPGVVILTPRIFQDSRGSFSESWNRKTLADLGISLDFVQDNHSVSQSVGTVRGLHCQAPPHAQDKLVRVAAGAILDVAVDVRVGSPHYGRHVIVELSADNARQLLVPAGFLHGFVTCTPNAVVLYKTSDFYSAECDMAVHFADPDLGIDWGTDTASAVLSDKDSRAPLFRDWKNPFVYEGPFPWEAATGKSGA